MNILVIGNGFDLANSLPTTYANFLDFLAEIENISKSCKTYLDYYKENSIFKSKINNEIYTKSRINVDSLCNLASQKLREDEPRLSISKELLSFEKGCLKELLTLVKDNMWFSYFKTNKNFMKEKDNWIDFETEISKVVQTLDSYSKTYLIGATDNPSFGDEEINIYKNFIRPEFDNISKNDFFEIIKKLEDHLNNLVRCLEIYLVEYVEEIDIKNKIPEIENIEFDKVLSFNYTHTFTKGNYLKTNEFEIDFIHGEALSENTLENNNMIIGIDEYLSYDLENIETDFIYFKKYFQRIHKKTGCKHLEWFKYIDEEQKTIDYKGNDIYIFGHSLDVTDKDVLKKIFEDDRVKKIVYYYNIKVHGS